MVYKRYIELKTLKEYCPYCKSLMLLDEPWSRCPTPELGDFCFLCNKKGGDHSFEDWLPNTNPMKDFGFPPESRAVNLQVHGRFIINYKDDSWTVYIMKGSKSIMYDLKVKHLNLYQINIEKLNKILMLL